LKYRSLSANKHTCGVCSNPIAILLDLIYKQRFSRTKDGGGAPATPVPFSFGTTVIEFRWQIISLRYPYY
jgi:hypothetical protein